MKSFLLSLLLISGCVTSGLKVTESKYVAGDCLQLSNRAIEREFQGQERVLVKSVVLWVAGVGSDTYVIHQYLNGAVIRDLMLVTSKSINEDTLLTDCPEYLQNKKEPN